MKIDLKNAGTMGSWLVGSAFAMCMCAPQAATISGAGSSAAAPIYRSWAAEYAKESGVTLDYEAIGSSAGLKKIRAGVTAFGASDVAPSQAELDKDAMVLIPMAITGVVPVIHLPKSGDIELRLTGELLARIFLGSITQWNAPEIVQLNPGLVLRDWPIRVVVRSDGSGTTHNFADYLAQRSPQWKSERGVKSSYAWPAGFLAVKGSDGVVKAVRETPGAIGYVDFGYVRENKLHVVALKNSAGEFVLPSTTGFRSALSNSEWVSQGSFGSMLTDKAGLATWPITMGTFVVFPKISDQPEMTLRALQFFVWAFLHGDSLVQKNNFVRLPDRVQAAAFKAITSIKDRSGHPLNLSLQGPLAQ
jgi:phosphate transport system substrate-binding protein